MTHSRVKSSNIHSIGFEDGKMEVRFLCGCKGEDRAEKCPKCKGTGVSGAYEYSKVPAEVHRKVMEAESVGTAFNQLVRTKHIGRKLA